jgi:hypothetical protein
MNVFLSYSHTDEEWADVIRSGLTRAGYQIWNPVDDIGAGVNWHLETGRALERSEAMIVLLSPDSVNSPSVRSEIEYALSGSQFRGRLIAVLVRPTPMDEVPWILQRQQFIRATKDVDETVRQVASALKKARAAA